MFGSTRWTTSVSRRSCTPPPSISATPTRDERCSKPAPIEASAATRDAPRAIRPAVTKQPSSTPGGCGGPHGSLRARADGGQVGAVALAPPSRTGQAGLKERIIPSGAKVTAHGHHHRVAKKFQIKTERVTWNCKVFNVYPDRS